MATKIRLARHGHKDYAFYHIVVADSRSPRDGKIIERIGSYNPNTNPATVDLKFDRAMYWVGVGAQPTDTVRNILSGEGVMLMKHLNGGVAKGAFTQLLPLSWLLPLRRPLKRLPLLKLRLTARLLQKRLPKKLLQNKHIYLSEKESKTRVLGFFLCKNENYLHRCKKMCKFAHF